MSKLFELIKLTPAYGIYRRFSERRAREDWERRGRPDPPPPVVKQEIVRTYARAFGSHILIETGTYLGEMIRATRDMFDRVFSVEIDTVLAAKAKFRFRGDRGITILQGDSGSRIAEILGGIDSSCLFWLDSHYSGGLTSRGEYETPILQELEHIFRHDVADHVILIDDARCFTGEHDYPSMEKLQDFVAKHRPGWNFDVHHDIIRIHKAVDTAVPDVGDGVKES